MKKASLIRTIFLATIFLLMTFGLAILSSAGVIEGQKKFGSGYYFLTHQFLFGVLPGIFIFFIASRIPHHFWKKIALPLLLGAIGLTLLVFIPEIGLDLKGARRWINFIGFSFQPAELLKFAVIVYLATWFSAREKTINYFSYSLVPLTIILSFIGLLLVLQPDLGTLIVIITIALSIYFFAGAHIKQLAIIGLIAMIVIVSLSFLAPYRFNRIKAFFNPNEDRQGRAYHTNQALLAIGSGGISGVGFGKSIQKRNFLPEPVNDSIFAIFVEELGFIGGLVLIILFILLILILFTFALKQNDMFARLMTAGVAVWICVQMVLNISAVLSLIPFTGLPLPFVSYGSSALVSLLFALGIINNSARDI